MLAHNNILKPQDGKPVMSPSQDMVIGCHYLTVTREDALGAGRVFATPDEAMMAYQCHQISLQAPCFGLARRRQCIKTCARPHRPQVEGSWRLPLARPSPPRPQKIPFSSLR